MTKLYQEINQNPNNQLLAPQQNKFVEGINTLLQSNPELQQNLKQIITMIKNGANPQQMFFEAAKQKCVAPNTILSKLI